MEATEPESVDEPPEGEGRGCARCRFDGDDALLVAGGRFWAPPARDAEMP